MRWFHSLEFSPTHVLLFFFFNDTATTEIYTLSLHDALPISPAPIKRRRWPRILLGFVLGIVVLVVAVYFVATSSGFFKGVILPRVSKSLNATITRSEEHTSELQSLTNLVCRLLLETKRAIRL